MTDDDSPGATSPTRRVRIGFAPLAVAVVLLVGAPLAMATAAGAAQTTPAAPAEPALVVALDADGSARTTLTVTFDLTNDRDREAFDALRENTTAREQRTRQFASRMRAVADRAEANAGREMQIRDPTIAFTERDDTGIVALSVTWDGLAARSGDELVLREPFASGFSIDRPFRVIGPDGYELATASPTPTDRSGTAATWAAGTSIDGFEATFVLATETGASAPGFGIVLAVLALLVSTAMLRYRSRNRK